MDPFSMKYNEIKSELTKRHVKISGSKLELQQKLADILKQEVAEGATPVQNTEVLPKETPQEIEQKEPEVVEDQTNQNDADMVDYGGDSDADDLLDDDRVVSNVVPSSGLSDSQTNLEFVVDTTVPTETTTSSTSMTLEEKIRSRQKRFGEILTPELLKQRRLARFKQSEEEKEKNTDPSIVARCKRFGIPIPTPTQTTETHKNVRNPSNNRRARPLNRNQMNHFSNRRRQNNNNNSQIQARRKRFAKQYDF